MLHHKTNDYRKNSENSYTSACMHECGLETFDGLLVTGIGIRYFEISDISDIIGFKNNIRYSDINLSVCSSRSCDCVVYLSMI